MQQTGWSHVTSCRQTTNESIPSLLPKPNSHTNELHHIDAVTVGLLSAESGPKLMKHMWMVVDGWLPPALPFLSLMISTHTYELFQICSWSAVWVATWICYETGALLAVPERDICIYISYICIYWPKRHMKWNDEMKTHHLFKSQDSKPCEVKTQQMSCGMAYAYDKIWPYDHHRRYSAFNKKYHYTFGDIVSKLHSNIECLYPWPRARLSTKRLPFDGNSIENVVWFGTHAVDGFIAENI